MAETSSSPAKKSPAKKSTARKSPAKKSPAKKSPAKRSTANKSTATKSATKKGTPRKRPTRKRSTSEETSNQSTDETTSPDETSHDGSGEDDNGRRGARRAAATAESDGRGHRSSQDGGRPKTSPMRIAAVALEQLAALTGRPSEGVVGIQRNDDEWVVDIEVLELRRIPNTTDVLARYRVTADDSGEVTGYHRMQRYVRGAAGEE